MWGTVQQNGCVDCVSATNNLVVAGQCDCGMGLKPFQHVGQNYDGNCVRANQAAVACGSNKSSVMMLPLCGELDISG